MSRTFQVLITVIGVCVLIFCCNGFMATFEPLERSTQITWRINYSVVALLTLAALVFINRPRRSD